MFRMHIGTGEQHYILNYSINVMES